MMNIANLFQGENLVPAATLAVVSFVLGVIVELALVKCCCKCGAKKDAFST